MWQLAIPALLLQLGAYFGIYAISRAPLISSFASELHLLGTLLMLSVLPTYLLCIWLFLYRETRRTLKELKPLSESSSQVEQRMHHFHWIVWLILPLSIIFGVVQNEYVIDAIWAGRTFAAIDIAVFLGNTFLWAVVGLTYAWRIPLSMAVGRYGRSLEIDLYAMHTVRPLTQLATKDVLVVAGALALTPLQALDAEFRWVNYESGVIVAVPAAIMLLLIPLWGVRGAILQAKAAKLESLQKKLNAADPEDVDQLETLCAHRDRIRAQSNWPFDAAMVLRLFFYAVIAPMAWVGAALVENLVDRFTG